ncbi:MAG: glycosyltransferase [Lachnospiraceae bacterium]|nr:glycosyltransferase [Lachnospiraceae bacterium]
MGLPYVAWLVKGYDADYYSATIRNEWNYIFAMDSLLCQELRNAGVPNCFFLPLAAPSYGEDTCSGAPNNEQCSVDVSMIGTILERSDLPVHPLSPENSLKDSTKGYLEGCIACQHQFHGMPSMSSSLPGYVWEDLVKVFPPTLENTILSAYQFYDYNYFNHLITYADRDVHLNAYKNEKRYEKIHLYSAASSYSSDKIINGGWADYYNDIPQIAQQSIINLVITHRNYKAGIPPIAWAIMGAKGFLLSNYQADYQLLSPASPVLYRTPKEMLSKSAYYYHHEEERIAITEELYQEISRKHTYYNRIQEMLSMLS